MITANQVTMARIFLLPVPVFMLIYGSIYQWWLAFFIFVILGTTDFIDGLMARKEGPTKLGSLLDPVADKIFVAAIMLAMAAVNLFPSWLISTLLCREFLMTSLRSSIAIRKEVFKTSLLGKLKTILQMGGCGTIFLTIVLPKWGMVLASLMLAIPFFLVAIIYWFKKLKIPFWSIPVGVAFVLVSLIELIFTKNINLLVQLLIIITITWASALDYLLKSFYLFRRTGMHKGDLIRVFWALVYSLLALLAGFYPHMVMPILISISLEFGTGGIDNIVAAEKHRLLIWPFLITASTGVLFIVYILISSYFMINISYFYSSLILPIISFIVCGFFFIRNTELFHH